MWFRCHQLALAQTWWFFLNEYLSICGMFLGKWSETLNNALNAFSQLNCLLENSVHFSLHNLDSYFCTFKRNRYILSHLGSLLVQTPAVDYCPVSEVSMQFEERQV